MTSGQPSCSASALRRRRPGTRCGRGRRPAAHPTRDGPRRPRGRRLVGDSWSPPTLGFDPRRSRAARPERRSDTGRRPKAGGRAPAAARSRATTASCARRARRTAGQADAVECHHPWPSHARRRQRLDLVGDESTRRHVVVRREPARDDEDIDRFVDRFVGHEGVSRPAWAASPRPRRSSGRAPRRARSGPSRTAPRGASRRRPAAPP